MSEVGLGAAPRAGANDPVYEDFLRRVRSNFAARVGEAPLFTTDAEGLFDLYVRSLPAEEQQHHTCNTCRTFLTRFGGLVTITEDGQTVPAFWSKDEVLEVPELYAPAMLALHNRVRRARVTGVFLSSDTVWGTPETGAWHHLSVVPPGALVYKGRKLTAAQAAAEKLEDFRTLSRALADYKPDHLAQAVKLLQTESLYRSEKCLGVAQFLSDLSERRRASDRRRGDAPTNVTWLAVAKAPPGFCHPRSSMIGTLLDDIASGMSFARVSSRFAEKMRPDQYQRPQAAPTAGNIAQAEKVFERMGLAPALRRRFARLADLETVWTPSPKSPPERQEGGGIFSDLVPKGQAPSRGASMHVPPSVMTWDKFSRTVLPSAVKVECLVPTGYDRFAAMVTAADPDAPPIIQWDTEARRNPVSLYVYVNGSPASQWGLRAGSFTAVSAITLMPWQWGEGHGPSTQHMGKGVMLILEGAKDSRGGNLALFPEILKADLREVRSTIEAYSRTGQLEGREEASACGLALQGPSWDVVLRVHSRGTFTDYKLDRWD